MLTKLDGTAKGGAVIGIKAKLGLPVLCGRARHGRPDGFDPDAFVDALFLREDEGDGAWNSLQRPTILERWPRCAAFWSAWATPSGASARPA
ncbi:MAG: hypothetical protein ACLSWY_10390 [Ruthenibacterium lactatiformans]